MAPGGAHGGLLGKRELGAEEQNEALDGAALLAAHPQCLQALLCFSPRGPHTGQGAHGTAGAMPSRARLCRAVPGCAKPWPFLGVRFLVAPAPICPIPSSRPHCPAPQKSPDLSTAPQFPVIPLEVTAGYAPWCEQAGKHQATQVLGDS